MKTIKEILEKAKKDQILKANNYYWKVTQKDEDLTIAQPYDNKTKVLKKGDGFELWSSGVESIAIIPDLKIL